MEYATPADAIRTLAEGDDAYLFATYAHRDRPLVDARIAHLGDQGVQIRYDEGVSMGATWFDELASVIENAAGIVYFQSTRSVTSDSCERELAYARSLDKPIVPVRLDGACVPAYNVVLQPARLVSRALWFRP
jgi:hypothetical protein